MSDWYLVACLARLRDEFNRVNPNRDKGADGSIGDSAHTSSSDHTPDEDSDVLRDQDSDHANEVHALDIDSSGPWPAPGWFGRTVLALVEREKAEYASAEVFGRLQYVIWDHRIASRSWGWTWRDYSGPDPHTNHAHFSARYLTRTESDTRPWGVEEDDMPLTEAEINKIADAVWNRSVTVAGSNATATTGTILRYSDSMHAGTRRAVLDALAAYNAGDDAALAELRTQVVSLPGTIAANFPVAEFAALVAAKVPAVSQGELEAALRSVLGSLDAS